MNVLGYPGRKLKGASWGDQPMRSQASWPRDGVLESAVGVSELGQAARCMQGE